MTKLKRSFFNRSTLVVAEELLGKVLVFKNIKGMITETEAYCGTGDPASHAHKGETPRTKVMFNIPGFSYVYLIYGMYHCLNFVTEPKGTPGAVLIRGLQLLNESKAYLDGPGKICRYFKITKEHNALDITKEADFYIEDIKQQLSFTKTPRIGIKVATDKPWRFLANL